MKNNHSFFSNKNCKYYPCHQLTNCYDEINCLFCFCPLYHYDCEGTYTYTSEGIKDCSNCSLPHRENSYQYILSKLRCFNDVM